MNRVEDGPAFIYWTQEQISLGHNYSAIVIRFSGGIISDKKLYWVILCEKLPEIRPPINGDRKVVPLTGQICMLIDSRRPVGPDNRHSIGFCSFILVVRASSRIPNICLQVRAEFIRFRAHKFTTSYQYTFGARDWVLHLYSQNDFDKYLTICCLINKLFFVPASSSSAIIGLPDLLLQIT